MYEINILVALDCAHGICHLYISRVKTTRKQTKEKVAETNIYCLSYKQHEP